MSYESPDFTARARDFSPGWLDTPERDTLARGATPDARNAVLGSIEIEGKRRATMLKRKGCRWLSAAAMATAMKVDGLWEFTRETAQAAFLAACNGAWFRFDDINTWNAISGATGYTAGRSARIVIAKNQALLHDGSLMQLYDGAGVRPPGFLKPTGLTNMSAAAGPGVSGAFDARYTYYDQPHDHESSPTVDQTATLTIANQKRTHTRPTGSPPAHVTHWRAYVRRTDIGEAYWFRVATVPIASATFTEAVIDGARVDRLPLEAENDPPTVAFACAATWKGYTIGFADDSSLMHVSKQGDVESWNPKEVFPVSAGDGKPVRAIALYGTEILIKKPHKSWRLVGERVPFKIDPLHGSFGSVSQEAGAEVRGQHFDWDEIVGPYVTDLVSWTPIADRKIARFLKTINRAALEDIRAVHDEAASVIAWAVPTLGSTRKRTLLRYNYDLGSWYPPTTGMEYACLAQHTTPTGTLGVYFGDYWGRVYQLDLGDADGTPSGTTARGSVTSATSSSLTDAAAAFSTTGDGLAGLPVAVRSPAGAWQWRRIASNTSTVLTLDTTNATPFTVVPQAGWTYCVGGLEWYWTTPNLDMDRPDMRKRAQWLMLQQRAASVLHTVDVRARFDAKPGYDSNFPFESAPEGAVFGQATFGVSLFGAGASDDIAKQRVPRTFRSVQLRMENFWPNEPVEILLYQLAADQLSRRRTRGAVR